MDLQNGLLHKPSSVVPQHIQPGDLIAAVAVSGPPQEELLVTGLNFMERKGFRTVGKYRFSKEHDYLAGPDEERVEGLNAALRDPSVRAVVFARGGYGAMRILNCIDCDALSRDPKLLLGMSDITALQMSIYRRCGMVTLAGPMLATQIAEGLDAFSEQSMLSALTEPLHGRNLFGGVEERLRTLKPGRATGLLLGGCLSLITALMGTPHLPDLSGAILFVEDIDEPPYRIDRMFTQLMLAGVLERLAGLVLGHFIGPQGTDVSRECERIVLDLMPNNNVPIVSGFPHGHRLPNITVPNGMPATLDTSLHSLTVQNYPEKTIDS